MKRIILSILLLGITLNGFSYRFVNDINGGDVHDGGDERAAGCAAPTDKIFLQYNNVKALIETGGLLWQDRANGAADYTVPKGQDVSVIYAGALWMGGEDINGQLKLAAQKFGTGRDFWTGPLSTFGGSSGNYDPSQQQSSDLNVVRGYGDAEIIPEECAKWDNFYTVTKIEIAQFISWWNCEHPEISGYTASDCEGVMPLNDEVLQRIIDWPAHGDESLGQDYYLAPFRDNPLSVGGIGFYDPINDGDYPWYDFNDEVDCKNDRRVTLFGDETNWWVFNDKGNIHTETGGDPIGMEVRAQAFTFATNDAINDMTFYNYELINRGTQTLYNTYFAQYVDADIGGSSDDYVGCDVSRGLGFAFNGTAIDNGTGGNTWGLNPPAVGVDFFEGPYQDADGIDNPLTSDVQEAIAQKGVPYEGLGLGYGDAVIDNERMGMRRFTYYSGAGGVPPQSDPNTAAQYYGFMEGFWGTSGSRTTYGGTGLGGSVEADYMFPGDSDPLHWGTQGVVVPEWSEITEGNPVADRRFVQVAGPFTLKPGAVNNLTVGVIYGRSFDGDLEASVRAMKRADTKAQALFDACFEIVEPPYAPVLTIQEMENELILFLDAPDNLETFAAQDEVDIPIGEDTDGDGINDVIFDQFYRFQGYQIYQMIDEEASVSDITDITKARLVGQCDLEDGISKLVNYVYNEDDDITIPSIMVVGNDEGLKHSFHITEDKFATGDRNLVNHKKYYFIAVSYAYNSFKEYDPTDPSLLNGQQKPYLVSRQSISGGISSVLGIPHNPAPEADGTTFGTYYGWSPKVTQIDGIGNGGRFMKLDSASTATIVNDYTMANPVYENGFGPINIKVIDPLNVQEGDYLVAFQDDAATFTEGIKEDESWYITRTFEGVTDSVYADYAVGIANEQLIPEWGISVEIKQIYYTNTNGGTGTYETSPIDATIEYSDSSLMWLSQVTDNDLTYPTNWIRSGNTDYVEADDGCLAELWIQNPCYYDDRYDSEQLFEGLLNGGIAPFRMVGFQVYGMPIGSPNTTYTPEPSSAGTFKVATAQTAAKIIDLHDVDIVLTDDNTKWTRCPVFEINDNENQTIGNADVMELRGSYSVNKDGSELDGVEKGMGWFPGYAIDINTGERLNMAFAENSWLAGENGNDMTWNPTSRLVDNVGNPLFGGMHYVYVFAANNDMPIYDEGNFIYGKLNNNPNSSDYKDVFENCQWIWEPMLLANHTVLESDVKISVRVNKPYADNGSASGDNNGRPMYTFNISASDRVSVANNAELTSALDIINIVPNPYYAYNTYETDKLDTRVKVTNLPERCTITIFNIQGALVRQYSKDDPLTSLDWDLKNHKGIPIAGGVYIIHIDVPGTGEKILKWYGTLRAPDLDNL
jgi:hypothetical protein